MKVVITAGGTSERIDNVKKITNSGTGKLGYKIALELLNKYEDIKIYYVCSKNSFRPNDKRVQIIEIEGTIDLKNKVENLLTQNKIDYFIHSMAVSDYMVDYVTNLESIKSNNIKVISDTKISSNEDNLVIVLKPTPKIISIIKSISPKTYLVGFKLLDNVSKEELISVAKKLRDKNRCDIVVANDLENIRNGNHKAYLIDKKDNIEEVNGKNLIAKKLALRIAENKI